MKRTLRALLATAVVALALPAWAETFNVSIVQTNDIDRMEESGGQGGFAKLAAVLKAERARTDNVLFLHSGDTLSPSLLSGIDKGAHIIDLLNHLDVTMMVPGNHEFDFGPDNFRARIAEAKFPIISSNIREADGTAPKNTIDEKIIEIKGVKFGFYGLTTETTPTVSSPGDITFLPAVETGSAKAKSLKGQGADIVVAVVHTAIDVDMALARANAGDLIISGHDEHLMTFFDGKHVVTESNDQANWVVITDLTIDRTEEDGKVSVGWTPSFRMIDTRTVVPDPEMAALVKGYTDQLDTELGVEIGTTETPLDSRRATVRGQEAAIGNLITDAMRDGVDAEIAITNGGGIRANKEYPAGAKLTRKDILSELPFGNKTVKLELTGEAIRAAIENGLSQVETGAGRFPQISGLKVTANLANEPGKRVLEIMVGDAPLDPAKTYTVATNDFMAAGGDGYTSFGSGKALVNAIDATLMASMVIDYVAEKGTVAPKVEGRIVLQ